MVGYRTSDSAHQIVIAMHTEQEGEGREEGSQTQHTPRGAGLRQRKSIATTKTTSWKGEEISDTLNLDSSVTLTAERVAKIVTWMLFFSFTYFNLCYVV